ncbi:hypothetical protein DFJ73DRAFT_798141 [Zopfochytrium polystomum]|nr:hypothetical protein DFJ73DRAFT_798141 [Zopfochytrium polystomum]
MNKEEDEVVEVASLPVSASASSSSPSPSLPVSPSLSGSVVSGLVVAPATRDRRPDYAAAAEADEGVEAVLQDPDRRRLAPTACEPSSSSPPVPTITIQTAASMPRPVASATSLRSAATATSPFLRSPRLESLSPFVADELPTPTSTPRVSAIDAPRSSRRHALRICRINVTYARPDFVSDALPAELVGLIPADEFQKRVVALNQSFARHWTLKDLGPPIRSAVMLLSFGCLVAFVSINLTAHSFGFSTVAFVLAILVLVIASGLYRHRPSSTLKRALVAWTTEDRSRRLKWRSVRDEKPLIRPSILPVAVPWFISVERVRDGERASTGADDASSYVIEMVDALPLYEPSSPALPPVPADAATAAAEATSSSSGSSSSSSTGRRYVGIGLTGLAPADDNDGDDVWRSALRKSSSSSSRLIAVAAAPPPGEAVVVVGEGGSHERHASEGDEAYDLPPPPDYQR